MTSFNLQLPSDWKLTPLASLLREVDVRVAELPSDQRKSIEVLSLTKNFGLIPQSERFEKRVATENVDKYKVVRKGWIVYNPYVIWEGAIHALRRDTPGIVSPVYVVWERIESDMGFLDLILRTPELISSYEKLSAGAVNRRRSIKKEGFLSIEIPIPPIGEQRNIARVLASVQREIEYQNQLLKLAVELKRTLLHKLFTRGIDNEGQKQTDIGLISQSWDVVHLGDIMAENPKNGLYKHNSAYGSGTPILRINDFSNDGDIVNLAPQRVLIENAEVSIYALSKDDIVTNRVNSLSHLGKTALVGELFEPIVFESNMMRFRVNTYRALPRYIFRLLNSPLCKNQILKAAKRAVAQSSINQGNLKSILIPLPPINIQRNIIEVLESVFTKISMHEQKKRYLTELFHVLLHQLMTGKLRVHDLDLPELEPMALAAE